MRRASLRSSGWSDCGLYAEPSRQLSVYWALRRLFGRQVVKWTECSRECIFGLSPNILLISQKKFLLTRVFHGF